MEWRTYRKSRKQTSTLSPRSIFNLAQKINQAGQPRTFVPKSCRSNGISLHAPRWITIVTQDPFKGLHQDGRQIHRLAATIFSVPCLHALVWLPTSTSVEEVILHTRTHRTVGSIRISAGGFAAAEWVPSGPCRFWPILMFHVFPHLFMRDRLVRHLHHKSNVA